MAAYKAAELSRELQRRGATVQGRDDRGRDALHRAAHLPGAHRSAGFSPIRWDPRIDNSMAHIELTRRADAIVIVPASADFLAKLAHGLADDLLSTLCLARNCPLLAAPAMNREMWAQAPTQRNVRQLMADGVRLLGPGSGDQGLRRNRHGPYARTR